MSGNETGVVLINGAGKGIGRGLAIELAKDGWSVGLSDIDAAALEEAVAAASEGGTVHGAVVDISDRAAVEKWVADAEEALGPTTALINNAIDAAEGFFLELEVERWLRTIDTSLTGYFHCAQVVARGMAERGYGRIVNHSSGSAERGFPRTSSYAAAKGGVNALTRTMATELAKYGITVTTLTTGPLMTDTFKEMAKDEAGIQARLRRIPMGRFGEIEDVTALFKLLISEEARWITGGLFHVDGGSNNAGLVQSVVD
jgi:3-oxoacyl-[acyl-carrier protein] reductase